MKGLKKEGRSFYQFNADLLGETNISADAELISLLVAILQTLGLGPDDFRIRLSDRSTWVLLLKSLNVNEESRPAVLDAIDKSDRRKPEQTIEALESAITVKGEFLWQEIQAIKKIDSLETLTERLSSCGPESEPIIQSWKEILALLQAHGADAFVNIDLSIVRGLAYYTGFVYEAFETTGDNRALAVVAEDTTIWLKNFQVMSICQLVDLQLET